MNATAEHPTSTQHRPNDKVLTARQVAEEYGFSTVTLQRWRTDGTGPAYVKLGKRRVGYLAADLQRWVESRRATSTADAADKGLLTG